MPPNLFERKAVRDAIKSCTNCDLHARCTAPVPFSGPSDPKLVVVGEAPGQQEDEKGSPFVGPSGELIREWLHECGWNVADEVAFVNTVSCYPNRTPTAKEVVACHDNLTRQLEHLAAPHWIVLGGIAAQGLIAHQVRIGEIRGMAWRPSAVNQTAWAVATWHPSAVLRNRQLEFDAHEDIAFFSSTIRAGLAIDESHRGWRCVKCDTDEGIDYKNDIPYCARHTPR